MREEWGREIIIDPNQRNPQTNKPLVFFAGAQPPATIAGGVTNW